MKLSLVTRLFGTVALMTLWSLSAATAQPITTPEATPTDPAFSPWPIESVRSVNTDPREGLVIVISHTEDQQEIGFTCSGGALLRGTFEDGWLWKATDNAWMCRSDADVQDATEALAAEHLSPWLEGRELAIDPKEGMAIITGPTGSDVFAICVGNVLYVSSLTYEGGEMQKGEYIGTTHCEPSSPLGSSNQI